MYRIQEINSPSDSYLNDCLQLMWDTQGINVCSLEGLANATASDDSLLLMAFDGQLLIGGAKILDSDFDYYAPFDPALPNLMSHSKVGSLSMMGIHPDYQGKGFGQKLSAQRMSWLKDKGCNLLVGISWVSGLAHTLDRVFEKNGFKAVKTLPHFFSDSSISTNLISPVCGEPPCICPATMYLKQI